MTCVIAITSGKGGVGKTNIATNLGLALSSTGSSVCIFDADISLANINILLGLNPKYTLESVLSGEKSIREVMVEAPFEMKIVPGSSGIADCTNLDTAKRRTLIQTLVSIENDFDYLLIDTAAGVENNVLDFVESAAHAIVVVTPEPTSLTDAFSLIKLLLRRGSGHRVYILVNMVKDYETSMKIFNRFRAATRKYLDFDVHYMGYLVLDGTVASSVSLQKPVFLLQPNAPVSICLAALAKVIRQQFAPDEAPHGFSAYWKKVADQAQTALESPCRPHEPPPRDTTSLSEQIVAHIRSSNTDLAQAKALMKPLIAAYVDRFSQEAADILHGELYRSLEIRGFPDPDIRDLVFTLESLYERQYKRPLRSVDGTLIKLMADMRGSEERLYAFYRQIKESFKRQFNKDLDNPLQELPLWMAEAKFGETDFEKLLQSFKSAYRRHFGRDYKDEKDLLIEKFRSLLASYPADQRPPPQPEAEEAERQTVSGLAD